jgi:hypothetical protein
LLLDLHSRANHVAPQGFAFGTMSMVTERVAGFGAKELEELAHRVRALENADFKQKSRLKWRASAGFPDQADKFPDGSI